MDILVTRAKCGTYYGLLSVIPTKVFKEGRDSRSEIVLATTTISKSFNTRKKNKSPRKTQIAQFTLFKDSENWREGKPREQTTTQK